MGIKVLEQDQSPPAEYHAHATRGQSSILLLKSFCNPWALLSYQTMFEITTIWAPHPPTLN